MACEAARKNMLAHLFMDICSSDMMMFLSTRSALRFVCFSSCRNALQLTAAPCIGVHVTTAGQQMVHCRHTIRAPLTML